MSYKKIKYSSNKDKIIFSKNYLFQLVLGILYLKLSQQNTVDYFKLNKNDFINYTLTCNRKTYTNIKLLKKEISYSFMHKHFIIYKNILIKVLVFKI